MKTSNALGKFVEQIVVQASAQNKDLRGREGRREGSAQPSQLRKAANARWKLCELVVVQIQHRQLLETADALRQCRELCVVQPSSKKCERS